MSDHDLLIDELVTRAAMAREGLYTIGWRTYRDGGTLPRNADPYMQRGYDDAQHAVKACCRYIWWSEHRDGETYAVGFPVPDTEKHIPA